MTNNDTMLRLFAKGAGLRGLVCSTTELAQEAARRHEATPMAAALLADGLTAAALLGGLLKVQQRVALKIEADGRLGPISDQVTLTGDPGPHRTRAGRSAAAPAIPAPARPARRWE